MTENTAAIENRIFRVVEAVMRMRGAVTPGGEGVTVEEILPEMVLLLSITTDNWNVGQEEFISLLRKVLDENRERFVQVASSGEPRYLFR